MGWLQLTQGRLARIELNSGTVDYFTVDEALLRKFLEGPGLAVKLLTGELPVPDNPLDEISPLVITAGLLTGTRVPSACKAAFCGRSPLTGYWAESIVGGEWGAALRGSGLDGLVITGRAKEPVYLYLKDGQVQLRPAARYWGMDTYQATAAIKEETGKEAEIAAIGPAGEKLAPLAGVIIGGEDSRAAGRGGFGALLGSKNIKAIAAEGRLRPQVYDRQGLSASIREHIKIIQINTAALRNYGTANSVSACNLTGDLAVQNWRGGRWDEGADLTNGKVIFEQFGVGHYGCFGCSIRCGKVVRVEYGPHAGSTGHGPEYETADGFGALLLNKDPQVIIAANDLCNRLGLDTISTSGVIALAMECYEHGLLAENLVAGLDLSWGNGETILALIDLIARREGLGELLSLGSKNFAAQIGGLAREFAMTVKGMEPSYHDPRAFTSMALEYATANRGPCHLDGMTYYPEGGSIDPALAGIAEPLDPHGDEHKALLTKNMQDLTQIYNSLGICKFVLRGGVGFETLTEWVNLATGWEMSQEELMLAGERAFNLKRLYNVRLGISRKDDVLPPRFLTLAKKDTGAAGSLPALGRMLGEYYQLRGWNEIGIPAAEKLIELGLKDDEAKTLRG